MWRTGECLRGDELTGKEVWKLEDAWLSWLSSILLIFRLKVWKMNQNQTPTNKNPYVTKPLSGRYLHVSHHCLYKTYGDSSITEITDAQSLSKQQTLGQPD